MRRTGSALATALSLGLIVGVCLLQRGSEPEIIVPPSRNHFRWDYSAFPLQLGVDTSSFSSDERETIKEVVYYWNDLIGTTVFEVTEVDINDHMITGEVVRSPFGHIIIYETELGMAENGASSLGLANVHPSYELGTVSGIHDGVVRIDSTNVNAHLFLVVAHELGHILGLSHDNDITSLMWPYVTESAGVVMPEDIDFIRSQLRMPSIPACLSEI